MKLKPQKLVVLGMEKGHKASEIDGIDGSRDFQELFKE
jgi:hypothetical protein